MKNEPWRGNPHARLVHVERKMALKRAELRALNLAHNRLRESYVGSLARIERLVRDIHTIHQQGTREE